MIGTLIVEDARGSEITNASGSAFVSIYSQGKGDASTSPRRLLIHEGTFETTLPINVRLSFDLFELDDGRAYWLPNGRMPDDDVPSFIAGDLISIPADGRLVVRAHYAPPSRLRVLDDETGMDLTGVSVVADVYRGPDGGVVDEPHSVGDQQIFPTPWENPDVRVRGGTSPIGLELDSRRLVVSPWRESLWVHAPGHAWRSVQVDFRKGGDFTVSLSQGGLLIVNVEAKSLPKGTVITLRSPEGERSKRDLPRKDRGPGGDDDTDPLLEWWRFTPGEPCTLDGIPFGTYLLNLEAGPALGPRLRLASVRLELRAGKPTTATLVATDVASLLAPKPIAALIRLDPAWGDFPFTVEIKPEYVSPWAGQQIVKFARENLTAVADRTNAFELPKTLLAPGSYRLVIKEFHLIRRFDVETTPMPIEIEVGAPVDVVFHLVDATTSAPVVPKEVSWTAQEARSAGFMMIETWDAEKDFQKGLRARVPAGRILLEGMDIDHEFDHPIEVLVERASRKIDVPIVHRTGILMRFRRDQAACAWFDVFHWKNLHYSGTSSRGEVSELSVDPSELHVEPRDDHAKAEPIPFSNQTGTSGELFHTCPAGDYRIVLQAPEGFEPMATIDVTVVDHEFTNVVIDAIRRKQ